MEENTNTEFEGLDLPGDDKLFNLAYWSKTISWVILIFGIIRIIVYLFSSYSSILTSNYGDPGWASNQVLSVISSGAPTIVQFFVLQAVGETLYLVIDFKEKLLDKVN